MDALTFDQSVFTASLQAQEDSFRNDRLSGPERRRLRRATRDQVDRVLELAVMVANHFDESPERWPTGTLQRAKAVVGWPWASTVDIMLVYGPGWNGDVRALNGPVMPLWLSPDHRLYEINQQVAIGHDVPFMRATRASLPWRRDLDQVAENLEGLLHT